MAFRLRFFGGEHDGETYLVDARRGVTLGRSPTNNIFVRDRNVSRVHCQIVVSDGVVTLTDLQSTNGTFVNNERTTETPLKVRDEIRVGTTLLQLEELDEQGRTITDTAVMQ